MKKRSDIPGMNRRPCGELSLWIVRAICFASSMCLIGTGLFAIEEGDKSGEETVSDINFSIQKMLDLEPPCTVEDVDWYWDGGSIGGKIRDSKGDSLEFVMDSRMRPLDEAKGPRFVYLGGHPNNPDAFALPVGSDKETALILVLKSWANLVIPAAEQEELISVFFDYSLPVTEREKLLVGRSIEFRWALYVLSVVRRLEIQRDKYQENDTTTEMQNE